MPSLTGQWPHVISPLDFTSGGTAPPLRDERVDDRLVEERHGELRAVLVGEALVGRLRHPLRPAAQFVADFPREDLRERAERRRASASSRPSPPRSCAARHGYGAMPPKTSVAVFTVEPGAEREAGGRVDDAVGVDLAQRDLLGEDGVARRRPAAARRR